MDGSQVTLQARASMVAASLMSCSIPPTAFNAAARKLAPLTPSAAATVIRLVHTLAVPLVFAMARYSSPPVAAAMTSTTGQNRRMIVRMSSRAPRSIDWPAWTHASMLVWPLRSVSAASSACQTDA